MRVITAPDYPIAFRALRWLALGLLMFDLSPQPAPKLVRTELRAARTARVSTAACSRGARCAVPRGLPLPGKREAVVRDADEALSRRERRGRSGEDDAISVWIAYGATIPKYRSASRRAVRDAFHTWTAAGVPLRFLFVSDSSRATVHVVWRERLPAHRAGQVTRSVDGDGWLHSAVVELSTRSVTGAEQDQRTLHAVALHEVGHLIGLQHSGDPDDVMAARVRARDLTEQDRASARVLYRVP